MKEFGYILPENYDGEWSREFGGDVENAVDRIGNLLILDQLTNRNAARLLFDKKRQIYRQSSFAIASKVASYENWDKTTLNAHQQWLAQQALKIWRVD